MGGAQGTMGGVVGEAGKVKNKYAIGMAAAKKAAGITKTPAHDQSWFRDHALRGGNPGKNPEAKAQV